MHCDNCGINLEPDFDDEDGMLCAQCKAHVLISHRQGNLTQGDVYILNDDEDRVVRDDAVEDAHIKQLYLIYSAL